MIPPRRTSLAIFALLMACGPAPLTSVAGTVEGPLAGGVSLALKNAGDGSLVQFARTDTSGRYVFENLEPGTYTVIPYLGGTRFAPASAAVTAAAGVIGEANFAGTPVLEVGAGQLWGAWEHLVVYHAGQPLTDAVVLVGAQPIPYDAKAQAYSGPLGTALDAGATLRLEVRWNGASVSASGVLPEAPVLVPPQSDGTLAASGDLEIAWTSGTDPDRFTVYSEWDSGGFHYGDRSTLDGSLRSFTLAASELPPGASVTFSVCAWNTGTVAGDYEVYAPEPGLTLRATSAVSHVER